MKKRVLVCVDPEVFDRAKEAKLNVSRTCNRALDLVCPTKTTLKEEEKNIK